MSTDNAPDYFDPMSTEVVTNVVCRRFEEGHGWPLADVPKFEGRGLYALYFVGKSGIYAPLSNTRVPVYVGKSLTTSKQSLRSRLNTHCKSISESKNLDINDFAAQALRMPDVFIALGERGLITGYQPVWNQNLKGFGSHVQGGNRSSKKSRWDSFHPGRNRPAPEGKHDLAKIKAEITEAVHKQAHLGRMPWHPPQ